MAASGTRQQALPDDDQLIAAEGVEPPPPAQPKPSATLNERRKVPAERTTELGLPMVGLTEARVVDSELRRVARRTADAAEPMPGRISRSHARMAAAIEPPLDPFSIVLQGRH